MKKTQVGHCKRHACDAYIGRGSQWGNQWTHKRGTQARYIVPTAKEAVACYEKWLLTQPQLLAQLPVLAGKLLGCWCKHEIDDSTPCHGDVLAKYADLLSTLTQARGAA